VLKLVYSVDGAANVLLRQHLKDQGLKKARTVLGSRVGPAINRSEYPSTRLPTLVS